MSSSRQQTQLALASNRPSSLQPKRKLTKNSQKLPKKSQKTQKTQNSKSSETTEETETAQESEMGDATQKCARVEEGCGRGSALI